MKLLLFDDYKLGVLKGDRVVDVSSAVRDIPHTGPGDLINGLIARFDQYKGKLEDAAASGQGVPLSSVKVRPPLPKPDNIDCMAVNYMEDGTRSAPAPINAFQKTANAVCGPGDTMVLPDAPATIFEGEAELAVVIGKKASNVKAADAMDYIFGYTCFIDGSARGLPAPGFFAMKSRDTFAPIGPCIVTKDEIPDPQKLQIRLSNNAGPSLYANVAAVGNNVYIVWSEFATAGGPCTDGSSLCADIWFARADFAKDNPDIIEGLGARMMV